MTNNENSSVNWIIRNGKLLMVNFTKNIPMSEIQAINPNDCRGKTFNVWGEFNCFYIVIHTSSLYGYMILRMLQCYPRAICNIVLL